jgi:phage gpG-like protein
MKYAVSVMNVKLVQMKFERMGMAALAARPAMDRVALLMMAIEKRIFSGQGRRGGGSWAQDSPEWLDRKIANGLDPRILHATLALRASMSESEDPNQDLKIGDHFVHLGSLLPYAARQNRDRPFNRFIESDRVEIRSIIKSYLVGAWRSARVA